MEFGSINKSFGGLLIPPHLTTHLGWKIELNGQVNEIREVGRVMTPEKCLSGQARVIKAIRNLTITFPTLNPYYPY